MAKKLTIMGAGESGVGAALLAREKGYEVFVSDAGIIGESQKTLLETNYITYEEGGHHEDYLLKSDEVVKSPGIPGTSAMVRKLRSRGIPVISEIEFGYRYANAPVIAVTGSNGKTTTTRLIWHLLNKAGINAALGGNIGQSFCGQLLEGLYDYYVLEVSSFQLEDIQAFKPHIAVILNITPDHLNRYEHDFNKYAAAKFRIAEQMEDRDYLIYNQDDSAITQRIGNSTRARLVPVTLEEEPDYGGWSKGDHLFFELNDIRMEGHFEEMPLRGDHNKQNVLCAILAALLGGAAPEKIPEGIKDFTPIPHRLEEVAEINGVRFVNDSKATNVDAVSYALRSFKEPVIWIAGGKDKGNDYSMLKESASGAVKALYCIGEDNTPLKEAFRDVLPDIKEFESLQSAVDEALAKADKGDVVLMSPACASFDRFSSYEERGDQFKEVVLRKQKDVNQPNKAST